MGSAFYALTASMSLLVTVRLLLSLKHKCNCPLITMTSKLSHRVWK
jgi:hypothetical protein